MDIYLAKTQGFCAGVSYAVSIVENALKKYGSPLYVYHEIVHNTFVVSQFKDQGVIFVEDVKDVPKGNRIIFSAHGVPPSSIKEAKERNLKIIDATCPLVTKVHKEAVNFSKEKYEVILIGHKEHQEVIGTSGYVEPKYLHKVEKESDIESLDIDAESKTAYITQTTLSVDETKQMIDKLKNKYPSLVGPAKSDLCYATQNRQDAVKELAEFCDIIIICGSPNSSNSNRLRETGKNLGIESYIVDSADEFDLSILKNKNKVGISSGASVPRVIVEKLVNLIKKKYPDSIVHIFKNPEENIDFKLPEI
ncbi:MAG: 4-hydroxy-3-methylbut-2-enyl diphosphate reductase [Omnitrophica WOR_2 bacterium GWF2_38_59]|nr:MAG: 4-hydroxy-3-methylbut-2-enyl diphosphate reductase [Omnitrophica WOR_2 bacterium GWF2_38_59]OGX49323.1 MAG: 4-hydroxy-3-methylbut-2-enyl diphosphate reductase [Omnitrophica WOR_2 bacterium RIFOXYA2_FULL_38_17]OGX51491.1 MAG: 4-hydroxy-3-methylbut-2-enyl diphosphate reductase [Omnitrophica WOR_2 bacterium RIFOXYA12_FULL_38_10]OGX58248.1 MAG: 4-hydroxy-3-methylbut-2-enyl diphosphate reductase [Omnitrophica WOR_2 bacterium RIFOXYB2_FULL_38_16]HBG61854.1 4-hydroxy-3-methylbut-2-enyl diphosp